MEVIDKRRWYIVDNKFSTSLMSFYVEISLDEYYSNLTVYDSNKDYLNLKFSNLENAFNFTETEVNYSHSLGEIHDRFLGYNKQIRKTRKKK